MSFEEDRPRGEASDTRLLGVQLEIAQAALSSLDRDTLLPRLLTAIARGQGYLYGFFWKLEDGEQSVVVKAGVGEGTAPFIGVRQDLDDPTFLVGSALKSGREVFCNRFTQSPYAHHPVGQTLGAAALLVLPVVQRSGQPLGALTFADADPERFSEWDVVQGRVLAAQVAQALENAELFKRNQFLQKHHQLVTNSIDDVVFSVDTSGRFTFANRAAERLTGHRLEEVRGQLFMDLVPAQYLPMLADRLRRALAGESVDPRIEIEIVRKDGTLVPVEVSVQNLVVDGRVAGRVGVARDITDRRRREAAALEEHRAALAGAAIGTALSEAASLDEALHRGVETLTGHLDIQVAAVWLAGSRDAPLELAAAAGLADDFPPLPESLGPGEGPIGLVAQTGQPLVINDLAARCPTELAPLIARTEVRAFAAQPIHADRQLLGVLAVLTGAPVTTVRQEVLASVGAAIGSRLSRIRAKEALRESEEYFRALFDEASVGMAILSLDGRYSRVNRALCDFLGYTETELLEMTVREVVHRDDVSTDVEQHRALRLGTRTSYQREVRYIHKLGHTVWVHASVSVIRSRRGQPLHYVVHVQDITQRKAAEASREKLEAQLRQVQKLDAIGRLAGGIAHDFNNLLTVILGRTERLLASLPPEDRLRQHVELIENSAERAGGLTRQLLVFSRQQQLDVELVDLNAVLSSMQTILRRLIGEHIHVEKRLEARLWPVLGDRSQLAQVVLNLALNARDAMPHGGRLTLETQNVEITETMARERPGVAPGHYAALVVTDTGCGMSSEVQAHLFEPFFTTKELGKGSGLGLAIVHGIATQAGGHIVVLSSPGEGATLRIYLPRAPEVVDKVVPTESSRTAPRGTETILLVEDDEEVRELVREFLTGLEYTVLSASDGEDALRLYKRAGVRVDLLLADVVMPCMSGPELAARLRAVDSGVRALYMSGYTYDMIHPHGIDAQTPLLWKPLRLDGVAWKVREILNMPRGDRT